MILTELITRRRRRSRDCPKRDGQPCTLDCLHPGCRACIHRVECCPDVARRLAHMGIVPGAKLTVLQDGGGPLLVAIGDSRIALGRGVACKLHVSDASPQRVETPTS